MRKETLTANPVPQKSIEFTEGHFWSKISFDSGLFCPDGMTSLVDLVVDERIPFAIFEALPGAHLSGAQSQVHQIEFVVR